MVTIFTRFKEFRENWSKRSPRNKHKVLYDFTAFIVKGMSVRLLSDCRVVWSSYIMGVMSQYYLLFTFYTFYYYQSQNDLVSGLKPIALIGVVTAVKKIVCLLNEIFTLIGINCY